MHFSLLPLKVLAIHWSERNGLGSSSFPVPHAGHCKQEEGKAGKGREQVDFFYGGGFVDFVVS